MSDVQNLPPKTIKNDIAVVSITIFIIFISGYFLFSTNKSPAQETDKKQAPAQETSEEIKTFEISGNNFTFYPNEIRVKKGDLVKINFKNNEGSHDFILDEFNIRTEQLEAGTVETIEFIADKVGIFEYYCSIGSHRAMGMKGTLTVEK